MLRSSRIIVWLLFIVLVLSAVPISVQACTVFTASDGETILVGNNEDWSHNNFSLAFIPPLASRNGYVKFYSTSETGDVRAGMNTKGVFIDSTAVPPSEIISDPEKPPYSWDFFNHILQSCDSVNDSITLLSSYDIPGIWNWQILIADQYGESVAISAGPDGNIAFTMKTGSYQLITNGNVAYPELGESAGSELRFDIAQSMLESMDGNLTPDYFQTILNAASSSGTAFSTVYDLVNLDFYVYFNHNFDRVIYFNLEDELELGLHSITMQELFSEETAIEPIDISTTDDTGTSTPSEFPDIFGFTLLVGVSIGVSFSVILLTILKTRKS